MARLLYTWLLRLALPFALLLFWTRGLRRPQYRVNLRERLAWLAAPSGPVADCARPIWVHGVSVGEVQAAVPLLRGLHARDPHRPLLLTTATATGHERARRLLEDLLRAPGALQLRYAPFDLPGVARRFLRHHRPIAAVFLETEIWPNLIRALARQQVPTAIVSARVSQRSTRRYLKYAPHLMASTLQHLRLVATQSIEDARRFVQLGALPAAVLHTGNLKFDLAPPPEIGERGRQLRLHYAPERPMWVAGSTHPGEEQVCLAAQRTLGERASAAAQAPPLLVLAPRHPERFAAVARSLREQGVRFVNRSDPGQDAKDADVVLVDGLGELMAFYAASDVAFVGGSLVPIGGHNLLEPAMLGKPVLTGPHSFNAPEAAQLLTGASALQRVRDAASLADAVWQGLTQVDEARTRGRRAQDAVAANRGAAERTLAALAPLLPIRASGSAPGVKSRRSASD